MIVSIRRAVATLLALLLVTGLGLAVASPASADIVWTAPSATFDLSDPTNLPAGVSAVKLTPGAELGGCFDQEFCVWTDALNASQPAGYLYRWDITWKGYVLTLTGNFYLSVSFIQNRWGNSRARVQVSHPCPNNACTSFSATPWVYGTQDEYRSLGGTYMNDKGKIVYSEAL
jgi:hypothetical protein